MRLIKLQWLWLALTFMAHGEPTVTFRFSPPDWQTAICLPDDPCKTLVAKSGELLYGYGKGGREFDTRIALEVAEHAIWQGQELLSPRVPIIRTRRATKNLEIVEEAFALTDRQPMPHLDQGMLQRLDAGGFIRHSAQPQPTADPSLADAAVHADGGSVRYVVAGTKYRIALALCEGWWNEPGKRIMVLRVEGASVQRIDTVADIGKNKAAIFWFEAEDQDGDGLIIIEAEPCIDRNAILNGLWVYPPDVHPDSDRLLSGVTGPHLVAKMSDARPTHIPRGDAVLVQVRNTGSEAQVIHPRMIVTTTRVFCIENNRVTLDGAATITASRQIAGAAEKRRARYAVPLEPFTLTPGESASVHLLHGNNRLGERLTDASHLRVCRDQAVAYWEKVPLPYGRIEVPDTSVQALLDASIRNIWQVREIRKGLPVFQPGPTCYRGLWIVDSAFMIEIATLLEATDEARNAIMYILTHQQEHGGIHLVEDFSKENGIVLWTCCQHARMTQDRHWLLSVWPRLERIAEHIRDLRQQTLRNETPLEDGLMPPGMPDGGQRIVRPEYTNPLWNLAGLRAFINTAEWLGNQECAARWQPEYDSFMQAFRHAAARDQRQDAAGNLYLPNYMGAAGTNDLPQRAQWTFCQAVYPGQLFTSDDPLVQGNLSMLATTERQGMVVGTGWHEQGVWTYFASLYAHAWLWQGHGRKACDLLYAFANHATPLLAWSEEHSLSGDKYKKIGDMPHAWASAEFIRLVTHLLAIDRGDELHLFEGLPVAWAAPGMVTRLNAIATPFGPLTISLSFAADGTTAQFSMTPLRDPACTRICLHLADWVDGGPKIISLDPQTPHLRTLTCQAGRTLRTTP